MQNQRQTHFHGTAISMFKFADTSVKAVNRRGLNAVKKRTNEICLPAYYTEVEPVKEGKIHEPLQMTAPAKH